MAERKKQSLLTGAGVLAIATVLVKIIGAIYKIPLINLCNFNGRIADCCCKNGFSEY